MDKLKKYLENALREIILIVLGILLALYINNYNSDYQYKRKLDENINRVYNELEKNIERAKFEIDKLQRKDSLIHLVMNDSIKESSAYNYNFELAYLIIYYHSLEIEDKAYQNLIELNNSENLYKEDIITQTKELYSINKGIVHVDERMSTFVYEKSIPFLAENIESFGELTYQGKIEEDAIKYFMESNEYKSYVSQYSIISIKNQLRHYQNFYIAAIDIYSKIGEEYQLENNINTNQIINKNIEGEYINESIKDTLLLKNISDSFSLVRNQGFNIQLIPFEKNRFFSDTKQGGYFISFNSIDSIDYDMEIHLLSRRYKYIKTSKK